MSGVVVPAMFGIATGIVLAFSAAGYLVFSLLALVGGFLAGLEHRDSEEGFVRGITGGLLFGSFILFVHALDGGEAKAHLPSPQILLVVITTVVGGLLGALGGWRRSRRVAQSYSQGGHLPDRL